MKVVLVKKSAEAGIMIIEFFLTGLIFVITFVSLRDGPFQYLPDGPNKIF